MPENLFKRVSGILNENIEDFRPLDEKLKYGPGDYELYAIVKKGKIIKTGLFNPIINKFRDMHSKDSSLELWIKASENLFRSPHARPEKIHPSTTPMH